MFDKQKMKELEQRSHNRGLLSKEFYNTEQQQLERKRREMKAELDRQVEERRRHKEQQKMENQRRIRKEEEEIKSYYKNLQSRDKRTSANDSNMQASNMKLANQPYQTYPAELQSQSRQKGISLNKSKGGQSKPSLFHDADIPLLPVMPLEFAQSIGREQQQQQNSVLAISKQSVANIGNIPLLNLNDQANPNSKARKPKQKTTKREKTLQAIKDSQQKIQNSRQATNNNNPASIVMREERRSTLADEESIFGSVVHANNNMERAEHYQIPQEVIQMEQENKSLKMELRKKEQALSLLIGAVRTNGNGKLDKYRVQAERILHSGNQSAARHEEREQQKVSMLPKINMKHQSIMHDYLLAAARRGKKAHL